MSAPFLHRRGLDALEENDRIDTGLLSECVHCGFCLPACPTYSLYGEEPDSPRGRIHLMAQLAGGAPVTEAITTHIDRCLGCYACMTACPSGVRYDVVLEQTRAALNEASTRPLIERAEREAIFALFPHRRRLRVASQLLALIDELGIGRLLRSPRVAALLPGVAGAALAVAPPVTAHEATPVLSPGSAPVRGRVGLLTGCVQDVFFSRVNLATSEVLAAEGFDVVAPPQQGCCGALSEHSGRLEEARAFARAVIDTFDDAGVDVVVVNSAGCGSTMKHYGHLLATDARYQARAEHFADRVVDVSEFLAGIEPRATRHPLAMSVAYHDACHLAHGQHVRSEPRSLLASIPGLELREVGDGERCCGSAGTYNLLEEAAATAIGAEKAAAVAATGAQLVCSGNPGCNLQIARSLEANGTPIAVVHTIEVLAASIADRERATLLEPRRRARRSPNRRGTPAPRRRSTARGRR